MTIFHVVLLLAVLLCALTTGFLFAFAVVVMPGLKQLEDRAFIRAFQVIDGIIQNNQPLFMLVWVGAVLAVVLAAVLGFGQLDGTGRVFVGLAALLYLGGVQLPTAIVNIPLNNQIKAYEVAAMSEAELRAARDAFEPRWNRWNAIRTALATLATALLIGLVYRL